MDHWNEMDWEDIFEDDWDAAPEDLFEAVGKAEEAVREAEGKLRELLKDRVKNVLKEAAGAEKALAGIRAEIAAEKRERKRWESEAAREKEEFEKLKDFDIPKRYISRIVKNMTGNLAPGDTVYKIEYDTGYRKCRKCGGKKKIRVIIDGEEARVKCPECDGSGAVFYRENPHIEEKTVSDVCLSLCFGKDRVCPWNYKNIFLEGKETSTPMKELYLTREAAESALEEIERGTRP